VCEDDKHKVDSKVMMAGLIQAIDNVLPSNEAGKKISCILILFDEDDPIGFTCNSKDLPRVRQHLNHVAEVSNQMARGETSGCTGGDDPNHTSNN